MNVFYIHGSVQRKSNLITLELDATYSLYYISVGSSTCFGCYHPSSGTRTTVITVSGIVELELIHVYLTVSIPTVRYTTKADGSRSG